MTFDVIPRLREESEVHMGEDEDTPAQRADLALISSRHGDSPSDFSTPDCLDGVLSWIPKTTMALVNLLDSPRQTRAKLSRGLEMTPQRGDERGFEGGAAPSSWFQGETPGDTTAGGQVGGLTDTALPRPHSDEVFP